ncbi:MAG: peptidylprolyl isomerase [Actinobacteria bacterium]|nr:peptidylprolyl isomerase [Actinomycetota bacterium]
MLVAFMLAVMACLPFACGCSGPAALVVNGRPIPSGEFNREVQRRLAVIKKKSPEELEGESGRRLEAETARQVATEMVKAEIMAQQASKLGVEVEPREVAAKLEQQQTKTGADQFAQDLESQGLTLEKYTDTLEQQVLVDDLGEKVTEEVTVTGDETESYFLTHKEQFSKPAAAHVAHILLESEVQAGIVADEIRRGVEFSTMAKNLSKDDATRANGGDMGWIEQGSMEPAFEQVAFTLQPGQSSAVVKTSDGYQVIKVLERREAYSPTFNEVKGEVIKAVESGKKEEKFADWLRTAYANAKVEVVAPGVGKWDPRMGMVVGP